MPGFLKQFDTEAQCEAKLEQNRWPQAFVCPCYATSPITLKVEPHNTTHFLSYKHQASIIDSLAAIKLRLTTSFDQPKHFAIQD